ncbi:D-tagatose-bisphosphate aldolase, class II, non-catalytic subunit [uncultured Jatrophihabitans sp.]|uniref:D-tagatose-bisphosphate aldolase, class II, non-catalytic subunit n=1 Tax=uncultured Jatrophihabitans sp. TaxID=1610747 RepID=UPI0035CBDC92
MNDTLLEIVRRQKAGEAVGITSVCSAHPLVLRAGVAQAVADGTTALIEATSNQVDQFGGYTGLVPAQFRDLVHGLADQVGLPRDRVVLGGDHLGPNTWRGLPAETAMSRAEELVVAYVEAGYDKIHLDCSMACEDDPPELADDVVAARSVQLARVAERAAGRRGDGPVPMYVIGTEVPVPGGAHHAITALQPTSAAAARATLAAHREAFDVAGLDDAWARVMALVVQPGVEFDSTRVVDYDRTSTVELRTVLDDAPHTVFEAHSTDYQTVERLTALVADHWAVLKVGPGLTFALREALFALAAIENELVTGPRRSRLPEVVEQTMVADPHWWDGYYPGDAETQRLARRYSYSDRLRYYWPDDRIVAAVDVLFANLDQIEIPLPLLSAFLPKQYARVREGVLLATARDLAVDHVRDVLRDYARACSPSQ